MKVVCKVNFSWEAIQYNRGGIYEIPNSGKFLDFLKVGYFVEFKDKNEVGQYVQVNDQVSETDKKWKELNDNKDTNKDNNVLITEKELKIDKRTKEYKQSLQTK